MCKEYYHFNNDILNIQYDLKYTCPPERFKITIKYKNGHEKVIYHNDYLTSLLSVDDKNNVTGIVIEDRGCIYG